MQIIGKHLHHLAAILLQVTRSAHRSTHDPAHLFPLGLQLVIHHGDARQWQLDEISEVNKPPESFVFRLDRERHIDRCRIDRAGVQRGQPGRAFTGDNDLDVLLRLKAEMAYRHTRKVIHCASNRVDADDFTFKIFRRLDFRSSDENVQRPPGDTDHGFDRHSGHRCA